jgi:putative component of membrane protein insertase Oxa1/YidC/SpoIIIJ protein YidD
MSTVAVAGIDLYRRYLSPLKGFKCAHNYVHNAGSCSTFGRQVYATYRFLEATRLLRARFVECKQASQRLKCTAVWHASQEGSSGESDEEIRKRLKRKQDRWGVAGDCVTAPADCGSFARCGGSGIDVVSGLDVCSCAL